MNVILSVMLRLTVVWLIIYPVVGFAQFDATYIPRASSSENSALIKESRLFLQQKLKTIESPLLRRLYSSRTQALINSIKSGAFIEDDSLQLFADRAMARLIKNNPIQTGPVRVLIVKNPLPNAFCYGEGTLIVTVALLARIENESQLAFTLAHELAHSELDHMRVRLEAEVETKLAKRTRQEITKIVNGDISLESMEEFKRLIYDASRYSREMEEQADSLGFIYFKKAGYYQPEALTVLTLLDSAEVPKRKLGRKLFDALNFTKYPFDANWLKPRLSLYSRRPTHTFFLSNDSLASHPDIPLRKGVLQTMVVNGDEPLNYQSREFVYRVIPIADFEVIESAYFTRQYDRCLHQALTLLALYPDNAYLIARIARIFVALHEATMQHTFEFLVPQYTFYYHEEVRQVNNFLYNLSPAELGEIAYHFLNNQGNFKEDYEEHYYLLWRIAGITHRMGVQEKIREAYKDKYPKGKYVSKMRQ